MTDCKQIAKRYLKTLSPDKIEEIARHDGKFEVIENRLEAIEKKLGIE